MNLMLTCDQGKPLGIVSLPKIGTQGVPTNSPARGSKNDIERWLHAGRAGGSAMDGVEFFFFGIAAMGGALTVATVALMMVPL
jgi:hypothetical protein